MRFSVQMMIASLIAMGYASMHGHQAIASICALVAAALAAYTVFHTLPRRRRKTKNMA